MPFSWTRQSLFVASVVLLQAGAGHAVAQADLGLRRGQEIREDATSSVVRPVRPVGRGFRDLEPVDDEAAPLPPRRRRAQPDSPSPAAQTARLPSIRYVVFEQPLEAVVSEVGRLGGYAVTTTREVRGKVPPGRLEGRADDILDSLRRKHGLVTMRDGPQLFVAAESESQTRLMRMGAESPARVREVLRGLAVDDLPRRVTVDEGTGLIQLQAPPLILERIETILGNAARSPAAAEAGITVIRFGRRSAE